MKKHLVTTATLLAIGILAGCGGSGGSGTPSSVAAKSVISGNVADGYLKDATVFLDRNLNYQLDSDKGEPSAITKDDGSFTLNVDSTDFDSNGKLKFPLVAIATAGVTVDKDTNKAVDNTYILSMHALSVTSTANGAVTGTASNFISPMSSQLRVMMETGNYATMQDAMAALATQMGLPAGTNMLTNYMAANNTTNTTMHTAATNMATAMGKLTSALTSSGSTTVDPAKYQGMMTGIFQNISTVKGSAPNSAAMTNLMGTMTAVLQNAPSGLPFSNISTALRGMMGGKGSSIIGGMMGGTTSTSSSTGTTTGGMMGR
jgi:hypothetical protein